jgi:DNA-binding NarL/FixJ family response regulator
MALDERVRVLLADDHPGMLSALNRLLQLAFTVVGTVRTGGEAVESAARLQPDVLVVDLMLPDMTGIEVCRRVMASARPPRIIMLTAADDPVIARKALESGACAFVLKYRTDLISVVEQAVNRRHD